MLQKRHKGMGIPFAFCTVAPCQAACCCFSGLFPGKGVHLHASNYWILLLSMMKYSREKNWAKRLPRQCVHSMALGGVIKRMGWKLSRFTLCSQGCCWLFFFFFGCSCKVKFIHEHKAEANLLLLTCTQHTPQMWPWRCSQTDREPRPGQAAAPLPPCPLLPHAAYPAPWTVFGVLTRLHSFINV